MSEALFLQTSQHGVVLRQLATEADDVAYFGAIETNREHLSQFGDTTSQKYETLDDVRAARLGAGDKVRLGIWSDQTFVGSINLTPREDGETAEIGYWLDGRYTGHGYATIAAKALGEYASERYRSVYANVVEGNDASAHVLERAGFHQTAKQAGGLVFELTGVTLPERSSGVAVREAQTADLASLQPILGQWIRDGKTGELLTEEVSSVLAAVEASAQGQNNRTYVVAEDAQGTVIGMMGMTQPGEDMRPFVTTPNPVELINAYVDKQQRGTGAGKLLAKQLEQMATRAGHTEVIVNSGPRYKETGWAFWTKMYGEPVAVQKDLYGPGADAPVWSKLLQAER